MNQETDMIHILQPITDYSLKDRVVRIVRKAILSGEFKPGQIIKQADLAKQLNISRGPVREALVALESEGLIHSSPNRSPCVISFEAEEVEDLFEVRWLLETFAVKKAFAKATDADLNRLEAIASEMQQFWNDHDEVATVDADIRFHEEIILLSNNKKLLQLWSMVKNHIRLLISLMIETGRDPIRMSSMHKEVVDAFRKGDLERAVEMVNAHNQEASHEILAMIDRLSKEKRKAEF